MTIVAKEDVAVYNLSHCYIWSECGDSNPGPLAPELYINE